MATECHADQKNDKKPENAIAEKVCSVELRQNKLSIFKGTLIFAERNV
jgi:hypothetical protein